MAGRSLDPVWVFFERDLSNKANPKAKCKGCDQQFQAIVKRMERHANECEGLVQKGYKDEAEDICAANKPITEASTSSASDEALQHAKPAKVPRIQAPLNVVRTSSYDTGKLNLQLCRFIVASNSPFSVVECPEIRRFGAAWL